MDIRWLYLQHDQHRSTKKVQNVFCFSTSTKLH